MPELPEVEGARRLVERTCRGKTIVKAIVADDEKVINDIASKDLERALEGRTLVEAKRRGKQMWWDFDSGPSLLLHFGMTGGLVVKGVGAAHYKSFQLDDASWPPRFCKLELHFGDGTQLAFCDSRRFAKVRFLQGPEGQPPISQLGWDPLLDWPDLPAFAAALAKQRRAVKALLLDQSFSAGVGNWVADEVCYQARIHPEQPANTIPADRVAALHGAILGVCRLACEVEADAKRFPADWLFHYRWSKGAATKPRMPSGQAIEHITVGGRTSAVVPAVQKLDKTAIAAAAKAAAGAPGGAGKKAGGGGGKKKQRAAAAEEEEEEGASAEAADAASAAAAEVAVAVAQGGAAPAGKRSKRAAAAAAGEAAAGVAAEAAAVAAGAAAEEPKPRAAGRARQAKPSAAAPSDAAGAGAGRGAKSFRGRQGALAAAAAADGSAGGTTKGKRKSAAAAAAQDAAGTAGQGAVSGRRTRARK